MSAIDRQLDGFGLTGLGPALVTYVCDACHELIAEIRIAPDAEPLFIKRGEQRFGQSPSLVLYRLPDPDMHSGQLDYLSCRRHGFGSYGSFRMVEDWKEARRSSAMEIGVTLSDDSPRRRAAEDGDF